MEQWKKINSRYEVSSFGNVRSVERRYIDKKNRIRVLKGVKLSLLGSIKGYPVVNISNKFKGKRTWKVHQLVAMFFIDNPNKYPVINHKNGNKKDNNIQNLEWCTQKQNCQHAYKVLKRQKVLNFGLKNGNSKFVLNTINGVFYESCNEAAKSINIKPSTLRAMLVGQNSNYTSLKYV